jgi:hypothetical protein
MPAPAPAQETGIVPVPVEITGYQTVDQVKGPDFGAYTTMTFLSGAGGPYPLLPYDDHRYQARLIVYQPAPLASAVVGAAGTFTAGAGGNAVLPLTVYQQYLTGFDVNAGVATAAAAVTVTVSNVTGGPYVYTFEESTTAVSGLSIRYPGAGLLGAGGDPTVTVGVGDAAGTISAYGTSNNGPIATGQPGIWIGSEAQVKANPVLGMFIPASPAGTNIPINHNQRVWITGDGANTVAFSVQIERFDSPAAEISDDD